MKFRAFLAAIVLAILSALPTVSSAALVHYFNCELCHRDGAAWTTVDATGVCIDCHTTGGGTTNFNRPSIGRPGDGATSATLTDGFAVGDASDAFGSNPAAAAQLSHNWGAADKNPAAGATAPSAAMYSTGRNMSSGRVTCYRCHDPHTQYAAATAGTEMLRTDNIGTDVGGFATEGNVEAMCLECHKGWTTTFYTTTDNGFETHPMYDGDYLTDYKNDPRFKTDGVTAGTPAFAPNGSMTLLTGGKIGCSTCHGVHFVDSNASTTDGPGIGAVTGDGKLLKGDGASSTNDSTGTLLCTSCHTYNSHPSSTGPGTQMGCLTCHSGHSYNDGTPNFYVLRSEVDVPAGVNLPTAGTTVTGLRYGSDTSIDASMGTYCTGCHGTLADITASTGGAEDHTSGHDQCSLCHVHYDPSSPATPSWALAAGGGGCTSCHGAPPRTDNQGGPDGYAYNPPYDYSADPNYKPESTTAHATHALSGSNPVGTTIACTTCHNAFSSLHNEGSFQSVFVAGYGMNLASANALLPTSYDKTGNGTCNAVYCHSNGGAYRAGGKILADYTFSAPNWAGSTISGCSDCHDDAASGIGGTGPKNNSPSHEKHVARFACNYCHSQTATSGSTVNAAGGKHVNGSVDLSYDSTVSIGSVALGGTASAAGCAVYCHSNGGSTTAGARTESTPSWDNAASGACGTCHQYSDVAHTATGTGAALAGAHAKHLYDTTGPQLACDACHTNVGSGADHVNGAVSLKANACLLCHGATAAGTGVDAEPDWGAPASVTCETCHSGTVAVINSVSAPLMDELAYDNGHGKAAINMACTDCHDAAGDANHLGGTTTKRLLGTLPAYSATDDRAFCTNCHAATTNNHSSIDGTVCKTCHNQHGEDNGNDAMIMSSVAGNPVTNFADKGVRSSYVNAAGTGICQTCHTTQLHFSRLPLKFEDATHNAGQLCTDCHKHDGTPAFSATGDSCDSCHGYPPNTGAHNLHAPDSDAADTAGKVYRDGTNGYADVTACAYCHTGADLYTYDWGADQASGTPGRQNHHAGNRLTVMGTSVGYAGVDSYCTGACHTQTEGQAAVWTATSLTCASCHLNPPQDGGGDGTAHVDHITAGLTCGTCHGVDPAAGDTSHIAAKSGTELQKIQARATPLAANVPVTEASWNGVSKTCNTSTCHNPSNDGHFADWTSSITNNTNCALCHVDTTGNPGTGSHTAHRTAPNSYTAPIACDECHTVPVATNHRNGTVEVPLDGTLATSGNATAVGTTWTKASATCSATYCHDGGLIGGSLGYSASGANSTPVWGDAAYLDGTKANDCSQCHGNPPPPGHSTNTSCKVCHFNVVDVTFDGFVDPSVHVNGILNVEGGNNCVDCHDGTDIDGATRDGVHNSHADVATFLFGKKVDAGDYGGADWYTTTYVNGKPMFGCGECHPANEGVGHPANGLNLDIDPAGETPPAGNVKLLNAAQSTPSFSSRSSVTCASVYCHSDANGGFKTTPNWYGGAGGLGVNCDACHGNSPTTGAHGVHEVGIHYAEVYDPAVPGLLTDAATAGNLAGHGDPNRSSTISCVICHVETVAGLENAGNTTCDNCHSDTNSPNTGNELASIRTNPTVGVHVNGQADVVFADMTTFKTKAQLRDNLADAPTVDGSWVRNGSYKAGYNSYDQANGLTPTIVGTTCSSVACHNGIDVDWQVPTNNCLACHTQLPK